MAEASAEMDPAAIGARLRELARLSAEQPVQERPEMTPRAIGDRLRELSQLSALCAALMRVGGHGGD